MMPKKADSGRKCLPCPDVSPKARHWRSWRRISEKPLQAGCWQPSRKPESPPSGFWKWPYESRPGKAHGQPAGGHGIVSGGVPDEIKNTRGLDLFRTVACPSCRLLAGRNAARRWSGWVSRKPASAAVTWSCAAPSRGPARMSGADFRHAAGVRSNKPKRRRRLITHVGEGRLRSMSKDSRHKTAMKMQRAHALFSCVLRLQVSRLSHKSKNRFAFSRKLSCIGEL